MLERRNPLPLGRYWVDAFDPHIAEVAAWTASNRGKVRVVTTEFDEGEDSILLPNRPRRQWYLFDVVAPDVEWPGTQFGFPTIVKQSAEASQSGKPIDTGVKTSQDTQSGATPEDSGPDVGMLLLVGAAFVALFTFSAADDRRRKRGV